MLRHVVLLTLRPDADPAAVDAAVAGLEALTATVPVVRELTVERDLGLAEGNADLVLTVVVDDAEAWRAYQDHPDHQQVVAEQLRPVLAGRAAIQVEA